MKFYCEEIPSVMAWDTETDKPLQFKNGAYETKDERIIDLLKKQGFKHDEPKKVKK
jgi:hypothetical protein